MTDESYVVICPQRIFDENLNSSFNLIFFLNGEIFIRILKYG
jgi:hypothetical protein